MRSSMKKEEKAELRYKMMQMVEEANSLRDEAAEKMYSVPKGYKLNGAWDGICFYLTIVLGVALCVGFLELLRWSLNGDDAIHIAVAFACVALLGIGFVKACAAKNRPYKAEEHFQDYYVNEAHCGALTEELNRLRAGIADYNRQYEEKKEYIQKFRERQPEVGDYGSLVVVLKANDFHAQVKMTAPMDEVDCRLEIDETGYKQLIDFLDFFDNRAYA